VSSYFRCVTAIASYSQTHAHTHKPSEGLTTKILSSELGTTFYRKGIRAIVCLQGVDSWAAQCTTSWTVLTNSQRDGSPWTKHPQRSHSWN